MTSTTTRKMRCKGSGRPAACPSLPSSSKRSTFRRRTESLASSGRRSVTLRHCKCLEKLLDRRSRDLRKSSALCGFLLSLSPLSCILMGWRGAGNNGTSNIGVYFGFGGVLMILGAVGEVSDRKIEVRWATNDNVSGSSVIPSRLWSLAASGPFGLPGP